MEELEGLKKIREAKEFLTSIGYFTKNLWHVDDVKSFLEENDVGIELTDDECLDILDSSLTHDCIFDRINEQIQSDLEYYLENR